MARPRWVKGTDLRPSVQRDALSRFCHRFTRDHKPEWAHRPMPNGKKYAVQFDSDWDWLRHTSFAVRKDGELDNRVKRCCSKAQFPDGLYG